MGSCKVTLAATSPVHPQDQGTQWIVWLSAVAIDAMCWRRGRSGVDREAGKDRLRAPVPIRFGNSRQLMVQ